MSEPVDGTITATVKVPKHVMDILLGYQIDHGQPATYQAAVCAALVARARELQGEVSDAD